MSYSAPRGEIGSPLEDLSYDGLSEGSHLRGGLGQLVDGLYGDDHIQDHTPGRFNFSKFRLLLINSVVRLMCPGCSCVK